MRIYKSAVYDRFRCIASACPDSCCKEWSVTVDSESAARYRTLPGDLGDRLRSVMTEEDGNTVMTIENGRCPMWRQDGLCRIQAELGHDSLCKTCREFPRLTHDYGDFQQWQLELSCPEAARLILESPALAPIVSELPGGEAPEYDAQDMDILLRTQERMLSILSDTSRSVGETLAIGLIYGYHAQAELDGGEVLPFDEAAALEEARQFAKPGDTQAVADFFKDLEILTEQWHCRLQRPSPSQWDNRYRNLARYFVDRYWLQAVSDFDLTGRVKLAVISCLLIQELGGDLIETAQLYSKEIENDPDNVEAILNGAYTCPAFTDEKLLGLLLEENK